MQKIKENFFSLVTYKRGIILKFFGLYILGVLFFVLLVKTIYGERSLSSNIDLNDISYEKTFSILTDPNFSQLEKDYFIQNILRKGDREDHESLILGDFTSAIHFTTWKKTYDSVTLEMLIDKRKIYSDDSLWILDKFSDPEILISLYNFLIENDQKQLTKIKEIFVKKILININVTQYVFNNLPENSEFVEYFYTELFKKMENDEAWNRLQKS